MEGSKKARMRVAKDETGNRYGRLTVRERVASFGERGARWLCACSCGGERVALGCALRGGLVTSCGCARREWIAKTAAKRAKVAAERRAREKRAEELERLEKRLTSPVIVTNQDGWSALVELCHAGREFVRARQTMAETEPLLGVRAGLYNEIKDMNAAISLAHEAARAWALALKE